MAVLIAKRPSTETTPGLYSAPMSPAVAWLLTAAVVWTAAALALNWGRLSGHRRRAVALLTSLAGIVALVVALSAHGQRETLTTGEFLLGGGYVTGHAVRVRQPALLRR